MFDLICQERNQPPLHSTIIAIRRESRSHPSRRSHDPIVLRGLDRNLAEPLRHVLGVPRGLLADDEDPAARAQRRMSRFQEEAGDAKPGIIGRICHHDIDAPRTTLRPAGTMLDRDRAERVLSREK